MYFEQRLNEQIKTKKYFSIINKSSKIFLHDNLFNFGLADAAEIKKVSLDEILLALPCVKTNMNDYFFIFVKDKNHKVTLELFNENANEHLYNAHMHRTRKILNPGDKISSFRDNEEHIIKYVYYNLVITTNNTIIELNDIK